jgi:hypothetical protein
LYRSNNDFKRDYQPRPDVKEGLECDLIMGSCSILGRWRNHFSQLLNERGVKEIRHRGIHTTEPPVPEPSAFEIEMAIER